MFWVFVEWILILNIEVKNQEIMENLKESAISMTENNIALSFTLTFMICQLLSDGKWDDENRLRAIGVLIDILSAHPTASRTASP